MVGNRVVMIDDVPDALFCAAGAVRHRLETPVFPGLGTK